MAYDEVSEAERIGAGRAFDYPATMGVPNAFRPEILRHRLSNGFAFSCNIVLTVPVRKVNFCQE